MMDILGYFAKQMQMTQQLHNDFMEVYKNGGVMDHSDAFAEFRSERPEDESEAEAELAEDDQEESGGYELLTYSPEKRYFDEDEINPDDPRFYGGMSIGLPASVYINNGHGRGPVNSLLPIGFGGVFQERPSFIANFGQSDD